MIRRDFLKFMGLVGATVALPAVVAPSIAANTPLISNTVPASVHERLNKDEGILLDLHFQGDTESVFIYADEGNFTWEEIQDYDFHFERGCLDRFDPGSSWVNFTLDARVAWANSPDFHKKVRNSNEFSIGVITSKEHLTMHGCQWDAIEHDMGQGLLTIHGRALTRRQDPVWCRGREDISPSRTSTTRG